MLFFDEATHTYKIDNKYLKSVSQIVSSQFKTFNANLVSANLERSKAGDSESPYYGMTRHDIMSMWADSGKDARENGTRLHRDIECFYLHGKIPDTKTVEWDHFLRFVNDHPDWTIVGCEVRVHNDNAAGTIDAVFQTPDGIVLVDWKRCKAIDYSGYGQGVDLMRYVEDCNFSRYSLQLSLYRQLIRADVTNCYIIQLHPSMESYSKIRTVNYEMEAKALIGKHQVLIKSLG